MHVQQNVGPPLGSWADVSTSGEHAALTAEKESSGGLIKKQKMSPIRPMN